MGKTFPKITSFSGLFTSWTIIGFGWLVVCFLQIVAVATPYWGKATLPSGEKYTEGLWQYCVDGKCLETPLSRDDPTNPGFQVQSLEVPGLVLVIVMACHWWMALTREIRSEVQDWIFTGLAVLGNILILAGIGIYGRKNVILGDSDMIKTINLHTSFILAVVVFILTTIVIAAGIFLTVKHHIIERPQWKFHP